MAHSTQTADRGIVLGLLQTPNKTAEDLLLNYEGFLYPGAVCSVEMFETLETFEARDDDFLIASYPKCGTNWVIQILSEMVSILKNQETMLAQPWLEFGNLQILERFKERPSPRILSTHLRFHKIPKSFLEKKTKILLVIRNPKDTATSYYKFHKALPALPTYESWDLFFKDFMHGNVCYGSYFDYMAEWNEHIDEDNVLPITFEDMKTDLLTQLKKISEFFSLPLTEEQLGAVESRTKFSSMKEKSETTHGKLGEILFRKGQVGDWKSLFTEEQSNEVDAKFQQQLDGTKLGDLLNYTKSCKF